MELAHLDWNNSFKTLPNNKEGNRALSNNYLDFQKGQRAAYFQQNYETDCI